jgi:hypothetical protein
VIWCEDVSEPSVGLDELDDDLSFDAIPKKMELDDRVLGEGDGGLIVHHQSWLRASSPVSSPSSRRNQTAWHAAVAAATYSA